MYQAEIDKNDQSTLSMYILSSFTNKSRGLQNKALKLTWYILEVLSLLSVYITLNIHRTVFPVLALTLAEHNFQILLFVGWSYLHQMSSLVAAVFAGLVPRQLLFGEQVPVVVSFGTPVSIS